MLLGIRTLLFYYVHYSCLYLCLAHAIQWGAIGDVGIIQKAGLDTEDEFLGLQLQRISSCLASLDTLLSQQAAIGSSYVLSDKQNQSAARSSKKTKICDTVAHVLG